MLRLSKNRGDAALCHVHQYRSGTPVEGVLGRYLIGDIPMLGQRPLVVYVRYAGPSPGARCSCCILHCMCVCFRFYCPATSTSVYPVSALLLYPMERDTHSDYCTTCAIERRNILMNVFSSNNNIRSSLPMVCLQQTAPVRIYHYDGQEYNTR